MSQPQGRQLGFARDQDIFETPDPKEELSNYEDDRKSESVQQVDMNVSSSYQKFKGKVLDTTNTDFSDHVGRPVQYGFRAEPEEYEMVPTSREPETLMQRYHRLKQEVGELLADVAQITEAQRSSEKMMEVSPADLAQDVELLQKQLHGLQLDRILGTQFLASPEHPHQTVLLRDLQSQLEVLKSRGEAGGQQTTDHPTYEVYTRSEAAKFAHLSKLSEVEERLAQLEALVGKEDTTVSTVAAGLDAEQKDLSSAVLNLQAKVALLDPAHISTIGAQLQNLLGLLEQVETKAKKSEEDTDKISVALETVKRVGAVAPLIPDLVARLHTLKDLHERASQFAGSVAYMADSQEQLGKQIAALQALATTMQESLQKNMSTVQSNFVSLESRLNTLQSKS